MFVLFNRFLDLALMRLPPQAFPASRFLFGLTLTAFLAIGVASSAVLSGDFAYSVIRAILSVVVLGGAVALALAATGRTVRWQQTATALFGGESVIGLIQVPVLLALSYGIDNVFIVLSLLLFLAWELVFLAHVYRHALDRSMGFGMLVAIIYVAASLLIEQALLPFPAESLGPETS